MHLQIRNNKVASAGIWYIFSNILLKGVGFLTTPIFVRLLTVEQYGEFNIFSTWLSILVTMITLDLFVSINRAIFDYKEEINSYIGNMLFLGSAFTIFVYLFFYFNKSLFVQITNINIKYFNLVFAYLLFYPAINIFQAKQRQSLKYKSVVYLSLTITLASIFFSFVGIRICSDALNGRMLGYIVPQIVISFCIYIYLLRNGIECRKRDFYYALGIALPLIPHTLSGNILGTCDQIIIRKFWGNTAVAYYSLAYMCSLIISMIWQSLNQAIAPWINSKLNSGETGIIKRMTYYYVIFFFLIAGGLMLIAPEVIVFFGGEKYYHALFVMPPVIAGCIFQFAYSLYVNVEIYCKKTFYISKATMMAAGINLILNLIFIPRYGFIAAAYTTLVGYIALYLFHFHTIKKMNMDHVYDNKFIIKLLCVGLVFMLLANVLYLNNICRLLFTAFYTITAFAFLYRYRVINYLLDNLSQ